MQELKQATTAHSLKQDCLRYIVHREVPQTNLRDFEKGFNRDLIIGLIGDRGGGKTLGGAQIAVRDYMIRNEPCFSNIGIKPRFYIPDDVAARWCGKKYGVYEGGNIQYEAVPLDIYKFLNFSDEYRNGIIFIDEVNIALADARRSMSYQNLGSADVGQQLRKLKSALIYTCINEAYVDVRIRDLTDFLIKTRDAAYVDDGMPHKREGHFFHWTIHAMTDKAAAILRTYQKYTGQKGGPPPTTTTISGHSWWGTLDTWEHQDRVKYKKGVVEAGISEDITENPGIVLAKKDWGWLELVANRIMREASENDCKLPCQDVMNWPEVREHRLAQTIVSRELKAQFGIWTVTARVKGSGGQSLQHYIIPNVVVGAGT